MKSTLPTHVYRNAALVLALTSAAPVSLTAKEPVGVTHASPQLPGKNAVAITYVANHGFLVSSSEKTVMIDSLFTVGGKYVAPSLQTLTMMKEAQGPFGSVALVLVTHKHSDHFNADLAAEYLRRNPDVFLVGPRQVMDGMKSVAGHEKIASRVVAIESRSSRRQARDINGVKVEAVAIPHHLARDVDHLAYLLTMNGMRILHIGDAAKKPPVIYDEVALDKDDIDVLIAPFGADCSNWLVDANGNGIEIIKTRIKPKHVIMGHLPVEYDGSKTKTALEELLKQLPGVGVSVMHPALLARNIYEKTDDRVLVRSSP